MRAFILAGGLGTRLRALVSDRPKPLAPVRGAPFLEYQLTFLREHGFREFVFLIGYRGNQIQDYFGDGAGWNVSVRYSSEPEPLGTGGALKNAAEEIDDTFLLLNGDTHYECDLGTLVEQHRTNVRNSRRCLATLALTKVPDASQFGSVTLGGNNRIVSFAEKSRARESSSGYVSAGIYVVEPRLLDFIPPIRKVSLEGETFPAVLDSQRELYGHPSEGYFVDIGTPEGLRRFQQHCDRMRDRARRTVDKRRAVRPTSS